MVTSNNVFHELSDPDSVLGEIIRILKPGGWVIVTDFRGDTRIGSKIAAAHNAEAHGPFSVNDLQALFTKTGLNNVNVRQIKNWAIGVGEK